MSAQNLSDLQIDAGVPQPLETGTWRLYLLACTDGRTYAGIALDLEARFRNHRAGKGAKFTRSNPPIAILGAQAFTDKSAAMQAEYALKQLSRTEKLLWAQRWPYRVNT